MPGMMTKTVKRMIIAGMTKGGIVEWGVEAWVLWSTCRERDGAAAADRIDLRDAHGVARADTDAAGALVRGECGEELDDLAVDLERNEAVPVRGEAGNGPAFVFERALVG